MVADQRVRSMPEGKAVTLGGGDSIRVRSSVWRLHRRLGSARRETFQDGEAVGSVDGLPLDESGRVAADLCAALVVRRHRAAGCTAHDRLHCSSSNSSAGKRKAERWCPPVS